jgi:hypothetical protein
MSRPSRPPPPPHRPRKHAVADPQRLERVLAGLVAHEDDVTFIARCIAREGPPHHQDASYALLALTRAVADRLGARVEPGDGPRPRMWVSPHHAAPDDDDQAFALALPRRAIARIEPDPRRAEALIESLLDGPTHHVLANVAQVALLDAILARLEEGGGR